MQTLRFTWLLASCLCAASAQAFIDSPLLLPSNPTDTDELAVSIRTGQCDIIETSTPDWAVVTIDGHTITVRADGVRHSDPLWCFFPVLTTEIPIGRFTPGDYTLIAQFRYDSFFGPPPVVEEIGRLDFTVTGTQPPAAAQPVPVGTALGWLLFCAGVVHLAWRQRRRWHAG